MCNHRYQNYESLPENEQYCSFNKIIDDLPLDKDGLCIFHSTDIQWKQKQDFVKWLIVLKNTLIEKKHYIKFQDFYFIARSGKHQIDYLELLSEAEIENGIFHQMIFAENMCVTGDLSFMHCVFSSALHFSNCHFEGTITFMQTDVTDDTKDPIMIFQKCTFYQTFHYVHNPAVEMDLSFRSCVFDAVEFTDFSNKKTLGQFEFVECTVSVFDMRDCIIYDPDFKGTTFNTADIENVSFRGETVFNFIKVESHLNFIGGEDHNIFDGVTHFNVDFENLQGNIYFENANISTFLKADRERLLDYERRENGKVQIGAGCIKYRLLSPDYTYQLKGSHQHLIAEIGHSFATFFTGYNGFNLGVEVRNKTKRSITLYYFTDDDMDKETFIRILEGTSGRILGVVPSHIKRETAFRRDAIINYQIDFTRSITKIAYLMQKKDWKMRDSATFFKSLFLSPNIILNEEAAHAFLKNIDVNDFLKAVQNLNLTINQIGNNNKFIGFVNTNKLETGKEEN